MQTASMRHRIGSAGKLCWLLTCCASVILFWLITQFKAFFVWLDSLVTGMPRHSSRPIRPSDVAQKSSTNVQSRRR